MVYHTCFILLAELLVTVISALETDALLHVKSNILGPPLVNHPFVVTWDVASEACQNKYGIDINLQDFDIVHNPDKSWDGDNLVIYYKDQIGLHPYYNENGQPVNGGLPQLADIEGHLTQATKDILRTIPNENFQGLAVIDWESWHPLYNRMGFGPFKIYQDKSIDKVKREHPDWNHTKLVRRAKEEYDNGAKLFMDRTVQLGHVLRPKALWGYYLYPDCYNYDKTGKNLTCRDSVLQQNNEIQWLFDDSTALYPSVYLGEWFKNHSSAIAYVANRIKEAVRVDYRRDSNVSIPVFVYHSITYRNQPDFLGIVDLRDSIGIASILGASGMVIWGDHFLADSVETCQNLSNYVNHTLGPFCKNVSQVATECSNKYCSGNGRCIITYDSPLGKRIPPSVPEAVKMLQLFRGRFHEIYERQMNSATGKQSKTVCQCYNNWTGKDCNFPQ